MKPISVKCTDDACESAHKVITIPRWDGSQIYCGPCGSLLEDQASWYVSPAPISADVTATFIAAMSPEERARLAAILGA